MSRISPVGEHSIAGAPASLYNLRKSAPDPLYSNLPTGSNNTGFKMKQIQGCLILWNPKIWWQLLSTVICYIKFGISLTLLESYHLPDSSYWNSPLDSHLEKVVSQLFQDRFEIGILPPTNTWPIPLLVKNDSSLKLDVIKRWVLILMQQISKNWCHQRLF